VNSVVHLTATELEERLAGPGPFTVVDVRSPSDFVRGHIPGAVNAPYPWKAVPRLPDGPAVVVCYGGVINRALARRLAAARDSVFRLKGGMSAGQGPVERQPGTLAGWGVDRRIRLVAGALVLASSALAATVSPWFLLVSGFVGLNLFLGGAINWCPMLVYLRGIGLR
jgi:rhodanese-related sulfurtransferase